MRVLLLGYYTDNLTSASWYYLLKKIEKKIELVHIGSDYYPKKSKISLLISRERIPKSCINYYNFINNGINKINKEIYLNKNLNVDVTTLVKKYDPDVILMDAFFPPHFNWLNLEKINLPKTIILSDPHNKLSEKISYIQKNKIGQVLTIYKNSLNKHNYNKNMLNYNHDLGWLPWSVETDVFNSAYKEKTYDVISSGIIDKNIYPFRKLIKDTLSRDNSINFYYPEHPHDSILKGKSFNQIMTRDNYAKLLSHSKIYIFDSSVYNYALMKYTEGMASSCLVLAPTPLDADELHFCPDHNFVNVNEKNFLSKLNYYLKNYDEATEIIKNANLVIQKYHSTEIRANELITYLKNNIENYNDFKRTI